MTDWFDLEQKIMAAWSLKEDIDLVGRRFLDGPKMNEDQVANALLALSVMADMRFNDLWETFEGYVKQPVRKSDNSDLRGPDKPKT